MINASLTELRAALDAGKISSVELATLFLDRIERLDASLNAFITVDRDGALEAAHAADARIAAGDAGPLTGIPLAHKDVFCTEGVLTTCGSKMLANFVSPYDAHVVSRYGMIAYASSLDQGGAFGASAADCAQLLTAMAGFDPRDSTSLERPAENYSRELAAPAAARPLAGLRIGLPKEFFGAGMADDVRSAVEAALDEYRALGATTVDVSLPNAQLAIPAYYVIAPAEASSNLSRFDGVRYGHRAAEYRDLAEMYSKSRAEGFGAEVKRRILVGTYVLSHGYYDAYYLQAQKLRRLIAQDFQAALAGCDVIAGPTSPTTAWAIGEKSDDPVQMYLSDIYTIAVNLAGLPGLSHPCGFGAGELPVGLQLVGDYFSEARLLNAAHRFQQASDWHLRRPAIAA